MSKLWAMQTQAQQQTVEVFGRRASGHKCDRCWNYYPDDSPQAVRDFGTWPNVCGRCAAALRAMGFKEDAR